MTANQEPPNQGTANPRSLAGLSGDTAGRPAVAPPRSRWVLRILLPALLFLLVAAVLALTVFESLLPATSVRVVPVVMKTVAGSTGSVSVQAPGWLEPDPHPYYISALTDGTISEVLVLEGDTVEAGDIVMRLVDDDARIANAHAEAGLRREVAGLAAASAELDAAQTRLAELVEVTRAVDVATADLARSRAELDRGKAAVAVANADLLTVMDEHERKATLVASEAVSTATVARLGLQVNGKRAALDAATSDVAVLEAKIRIAEASLAAAERTRELLIDERRAVAVARSAVDAAEAAVAAAAATQDEAALALARTTVRAPFGGVVLRRLVSPGATLMRVGDPYAAHVLHLYDPSKLQVRVDVPLADAARVGLEQQAQIIVEVLPDRVFTGRVTRIVHEADIQKNTVEVKVAVDDPSIDLKPEMLARVRFLAAEMPADGESSRESVFVPRALIGSGDVVRIVTDRSGDRGVIEVRNVTVGSRVIDDWIEIESGLSPGDLLVAEPSSGLEAGERVEVAGEAGDRP
ncbi:MAG: efflux RND transporter periplasmic adaptor subunit [Planctomycetota bacterium]|jgi:RND family efflux transporter MFP subunit